MLQEGSFSLPSTFLEMEEAKENDRDWEEEEKEMGKEEEKEEERDPSSYRDPSL